MERLELRMHVAGDGDAVGFEVGGAVIEGVVEEDGLAQHGQVAAGVVVEVAGDGVVVIQDQHVGGFAFGAEDGVFEGAVEGRRRERGDGVCSGADCGDDHRAGMERASREKQVPPLGLRSGSE
jgi:hypothetical protein